MNVDWKSKAGSVLLIQEFRVNKLLTASSMFTGYLTISTAK